MARAARITLSLAGLLGLVAAAPALGQGLGAATPNGALRLARPVQAVKQTGAVYIVQLAEPPAASYGGGTSGFAATKPAPGERFDARASAVESYVQHLAQAQDRVLLETGVPVGEKLQAFRYALNGFTVRLDAAQASRLARHPAVQRIWPDTEQTLRTNNSSAYLGLQNLDGGLRAGLGLSGEGVVIGVIDSGIAPDHPSLRDTVDRIPKMCQSDWATASWLGLFLCHSVRRNPPQDVVYEPPVGFHGICQEGDGFTAAHCNNKLIGARYYIDGFLARNHDLDENEFLSPRDADGHGTHIATIAAGNATTARLFGTRLGTVSGIAPRARVAVYKACWLKPGERRATCATSDLTRAIDDAVADGVDIISYSVGSLETDLLAPDDLALLNALDAGVLTAVAAGNDGPDEATIGSPSSDPWVLTVGASTQAGTAFDEALRVIEPDDLAGFMPIREASFTPPLPRDAPVAGDLVLVDDGQDALVGGGIGHRNDACEPLVNASDVNGRIALIKRGGCNFDFKIARAQDAGAIAAVVFNDAGPPIEMQGASGGVRIPAVMVGSADGQDLVTSLAAEEDVRLELQKGVFAQRSLVGNQLAEFSSRGPSLSEPDFVKPDITAPGVDILAGHTPSVANGQRGETFQYQSGTSMAAPEVAGVLALLKEAHPTWSPSALKSALMTSANAAVRKDDGTGTAGPFDVGAGHIDANAAVDPGLVYESGFVDHVAYLCGLDPLLIGSADCELLAKAGLSSQPSALNLPSIGLSALVSGDVLTRRVTNVGPPATYRAVVDQPLGLTITVEPASLSLATGQTAEYGVRFERSGAPLDVWSFGRLRWTDDEREVGSPIAVQPVTLRAPAELLYAGSTGAATLPVALGYSGSYAAVAHGLRAPLVFDGYVGNDLSRSFSFRDSDGVTMHLVEVPPDQLFVRFALFDEETDGDDDLDLYLFMCPSNDCMQVAQSGGFSSNERIDLVLPNAGLYAVLVHGFETDEASGGTGAEYSLYGWSFGIADDVGNLVLPPTLDVTEGNRLDLALSWSGLAPATRYLGGISHNTPAGIYAFTVIGVLSP